MLPLVAKEQRWTFEDSWFEKYIKSIEEYIASSTNPHIEPEVFIRGITSFTELLNTKKMGLVHEPLVITRSTKLGNGLTVLAEMIAYAVRAEAKATVLDFFALNPSTRIEDSEMRKMVQDGAVPANMVSGAIPSLLFMHGKVRSGRFDLKIRIYALRKEENGWRMELQSHEKIKNSKAWFIDLVALAKAIRKENMNHGDITRGIEKHFFNMTKENA